MTNVIINPLMTTTIQAVAKLTNSIIRHYKKIAKVKIMKKQRHLQADIEIKRIKSDHKQKPKLLAQIRIVNQETRQIKLHISNRYGIKSKNCHQKTKQHQKRC